MKDSEYFKMKLKSYSKLANFDEHGARAINKEFKSDAAFFSLGHLTEELLQGDKKSLKEKFIITDNVKPSASLGVLADAMIENNATENLNTAVTLSRGLGLWDNVKKEEVYEKKIDIPQFWEYLRLQKTNKILVSHEDYHKAMTMKKGLLESGFTRGIFNLTKDEELKYQEVIIWNKETCKSKLDIIKINHKNKTITPYDLKTTGFDKERFIGSFYKLRYYIQASMYYDAMEEWRFNNYPDYKLKPFQFIVVQGEDPTNPMVYTVSDLKLGEGRDGFYNEDGKLLRKGYLQLINEYDWHINMDKFDFSVDTYEADGNILID